MSRKKKVISFGVDEKKNEGEYKEILAIKKSSTGIVVPITSLKNSTHITACDNQGSPDIHMKDNIGRKYDILASFHEAEDKIKRTNHEQFRSIEEFKLIYPDAIVPCIKKNNIEQIKNDLVQETKEGEHTRFMFAPNQFVPLIPNAIYVKVKDFDFETILPGSNTMIYTLKGEDVKWYVLNHESDKWVLTDLEPLKQYMKQFINFLGPDAKIVEEIDNALKRYLMK